MIRIVAFCLALDYTLGSIQYVEGVGLPYIVQGENAEDGKYPYQVSLHVNNGTKRSHLCGGSILTKNWILTAGHCCATFRGAHDILVGTNYISKGGQVYKTSSYKIHNNYNPTRGFWNDICVVKTAKPITFNSTVQPVTLPPQGKELKEGDTLNVTGWGYVKPGMTNPDRLQVGKNYTYVPNRKCAELTKFDVFNGHLCVLGKKQGAGICWGDSGSPLVRNGVQHGIASFIFLPCGGKTPDFFARVANYVNWIKQTLGPDAKDLKIAKS